MERIRVENAEREKKTPDGDTETPGEKKSLLKQTFDNAFGSGRPVKVGGFIKELATTAIINRTKHNPPSRLENLFKPYKTAVANATAVYLGVR